MGLIVYDATNGELKRYIWDEVLSDDQLRARHLITRGESVFFSAERIPGGLVAVKRELQQHLADLHFIHD